MKRRHVLSLTAGALAAACARPSRAAQLAPIRIALVASDSAGLCEYGRSAGFLDRAGITVDEQYLGNGPASISALLGGTIDVTPVNALTALQAREKGLPLTIIAMEAIYRNGQASTLLLVHKDSPIRSAGDLAGKTVAVSSLQSNPHISVMKWIDKNGGDSKSVKYTELPFAAMPAALEAKRFDAVMVAEPGVTGSLGFARILGDAYGSYGSTFLMDCFVSTTAWTDAHSAETRSFCNAMLATAAWANRHHPETARILSAALKVDLHIVETMRRAVFGERVMPQMLLPVIAAGTEYGALTKPPSAASMFSPYVMSGA